MHLFNLFKYSENCLVLLYENAANDSKNYWHIFEIRYIFPAQISDSIHQLKKISNLSSLKVDTNFRHAVLLIAREKSFLISLSTAIFKTVSTGQRLSPDVNNFIIIQRELQCG